MARTISLGAQGMTFCETAAAVMAAALVRGEAGKHARADPALVVPAGAGDGGGMGAAA